MCTLLDVLFFFLVVSYVLTHNAACKGENSFSGASRFDVEDLVVNLLLI